MNRRRFLGTAACSVMATTWFHRSEAQTRKAVLSLRTAATGRHVPESFTGLSYELAQLTEPTFFSPEHRDLIVLFRRLSPSGILRLGGNTSEFCWFRATPDTPAPKLHVPSEDLSKNWMPHQLFEIRPEAIDALAGFLDATGWSVIYGLNFGNSTPERAAAEAAYVHNKLGHRLVFFQIGNEPDFYHDANNGTRPPGWGFSDYIREWVDFANAISERVPDARFRGPDTGASSDWVVRFGEEVAPKLRERLVALTGHYYAEGPPNDPRVTTKRLLAGDPRVISSTRAIVRVADAHNLVFHMTEGNSCYRGGKPGMSNAFASSLWAGDYLLTLATEGCGGVNLHGGDSRFLSASLGNHNPGLEVAGHQNAPAPNGFYTPIRSERGQPVSAQPVFYGMLLAQQFAGATMLQLDPLPFPDVTAYAGAKNGRQLVAIFNKGESGAVNFTVKMDKPIHRAEAWKLTAPALDATSGVTLGGAAIANDGSWKPKAESLRIRSNSVDIEVPAASGVLVFLR